MAKKRTLELKSGSGLLHSAGTSSIPGCVFTQSITILWMSADAQYLTLCIKSRLGFDHVSWSAVTLDPLC